MIKVFFDTEFTGLHQHTTLISLGAVSECGKAFYAEFGDYDSKQVDSWIYKNVTSKLRFVGKDVKGWCNCSVQNAGEPNALTEVYGNTQFIEECLRKWLKQFGQVEMWSDCLAYDWVLFNNLFGGARAIPKCVHYIPFDICTLFKIKGVDPDISREEFVLGEKSVKHIPGKHTALWDAQVIKLCYDKLMKA